MRQINGKDKNRNRFNGFTRRALQVMKPLKRFWVFGDPYPTWLKSGANERLVYLTSLK